MTSSTLRELIEDAASAINTYRNPDVSECQERLNEILVAAGWRDISHDRLTYVGISGGQIRILTEYSVRGCDQSDDYEFPESIIDADNPVKAVTRWRLEQRVKKAKSKADEARLMLSGCEAELMNAEEALEAFLTVSSQSEPGQDSSPTFG